MTVAARFLLAMSVGTAVVVFAVAGLSQASSPFAPSSPGTTDARGAGLSDGTELSDDDMDDAATAASLFVRVQLPSSLQPGTTRQVRIGVEDRPVRTGVVDAAASTEQLFEVELDIAAADGADGLTWIAPNRALVLRRAVPWTRFDVTLRSDAPCGGDIGALRVRVRDLSDDTLTGETVVSLPPVHCVDPPIALPTSDHDTETDCGGPIQDTRRVPRQSPDGTSTTCRLPRSPRPAPRPPVVDDEPDDEVDEEDAPPEDEPDEPDQADEPEPPEDVEEREPNGEREPAGDDADPASPRDSNGADTNGE